MFSGLILALGLGLVAVVITFLHIEHGPGGSEE